MKKLNYGTISGNQKVSLRFNKITWTLKGAKEYLKEYTPYGCTKWKQIPGWDPNGEEHWIFEANNSISYLP